MNEHEIIAARNIRNCVNWVVGGYYNCIQDHTPEYLPESYEALKQEIYDSAMKNLYKPGYEGYNKAPKEMRFAGTEFIKKKIDQVLREDGDVQEIAEVCGWDLGTDYENKAIRHAEKIGVYEFKVHGNVMEYLSFFSGEGWYYIIYDLDEEKETYRELAFPWNGFTPYWLKTETGADRYNYCVG